MDEDIWEVLILERDAEGKVYGSPVPVVVVAKDRDSAIVKACEGLTPASVEREVRVRPWGGR